MNAGEVSKLIAPKIALLKSENTVSGYIQTKPEFNPVYKKCVDLREKIEIHTEFGIKPVDMINRRGPNEDDKQYQYRVNNWESVTMPYWTMALGELNRIMVPSNYSVQWAEDQTKEIDYFNRQIPGIGNIDTYFREIVIEQKIIDPNSLIVVRPISIPIIETQIEGETVLVYDDRQQVKPVPIVVDCRRVLDFSDDEFAIIRLLEKSIVKVEGKSVKEGIILEVYDNENIWRIEQIGKKSDYEFTNPILYYSHKIGKLPCRKLKGYPKQSDTSIYYESYFLPAVPNSNIALFTHSNLDLSTTTQMFPQRSELADTCDETDCQGRGWHKEFKEGKEIVVNCLKCNGTGRLSRVGPMQTKQLRVPDSNDPTDTAVMPEPPGIWYTAPPSEPLEFVFEKYKFDIHTAFSFLNIDVSNSNVKGSETALGRQIDRESLFAFLTRISGEVFDLYAFVIFCMGNMRYGPTFKMPKIAEPSSFQIRSEFDLTEEISEGKKAGLPDIITRELTRELMSKRFSSIANIEDIVNLVFSVDRFVTFNTVEIAARLANGTAAKWEVILHDSIYTFIANLAIEDKSFFEMDFESQKKKLVDLAKETEKQLNGDTIPPIDKAFNNG